MANPIKVIKKVTKAVTAGKAKSITREERYGLASHKAIKQKDSFVKQYAKYAKKSGSNLRGNQELAEDLASKSVSKKVGPKVPIKKKRGK